MPFSILFAVGCSSESGYCEVTETSVDAGQETSSGFTSQDFINSIPAAATHGFQWDDDSSTCLNYTIALDLNSASEVDETPVQGKEGLVNAINPVVVDPTCESYVSMRGTMTLVTTDSKLDEEVPVEVKFYVKETGNLAYVDATTSTLNGTYEPDCSPQDCYDNASIEFEFLGSFSDDTTDFTFYINQNNDDGSRGGWSVGSWGTEYDNGTCE